MSPFADLVDTLRQPDHTGENRCTPCTIVNVAIAASVAVLVAVVNVLLGVGALVAGLIAIYLRGYLVPGTPTLTKRYVPDRALRLFDKEPEATDARSGSQSAEEDAESVDPEELLLDVGAVRPCDDVDDLCLTDEFDAAWKAAIDECCGDPTDPERLGALFGADPDLLHAETGDGSPLVSASGVGRNRWISEGALLADLAADVALREHDERWTELAAHRRLPILKALRSFLDDCPLCGGVIEMGDEEVESCCRSWTVIAVTCTECEERYLEVDPHDVQSADV